MDISSILKVNQISTNFPRGISASNRWRIDKDVSIDECFVVISHTFPKIENTHPKIDKIQLVAN